MCDDFEVGSLEIFSFLFFFGSEQSSYFFYIYYYKNASLLILIHGFRIDCAKSIEISM